MKIDPTQIRHQAECDLSAQTVTADELAALRTLEARVSALAGEHSKTLGIHFSGALDEQVGSLFRRYHEVATEALGEAKRFNDDLCTYLRAIVLVLDMTANASTHAEKAARLRGAIELLESAIGKVREHSFGIAYCSRRFSADVFRSDYPTRHLVDRIHVLERQLEEAKANGEPVMSGITTAHVGVSPSERPFG